MNKKICNEKNNEITKEEKKHNHMTLLQKKYFNKICEKINKAREKNQNTTHFYFNYYDFVNDKLGKPLGFLNEFLREMSYDYSRFVNYDDNNEPITFKRLYGYSFDWQVRGRNLIIFSWNN